MENTELLKLPKNILEISGTKLSSQNSQLLVSSGISSLDELLGGGLPIGTVLLIEEDLQGVYAKVILRYFFAEGIVNNHTLLVASLDTSTDSIIKQLPAVITSDPEPNIDGAASLERMKIAFRYQSLPTTEPSKSSQFANYYDLTKVMSPDMINKADICHWELEDELTNVSETTFLNPFYHNLLENIKVKIQQNQFKLGGTDKRSVARIGLHALGSPMWFANNSLNPDRDLNMFIFCLRALIRTALAVAVVTVPSHLINNESLGRCIYSSDIAVKLQTFSGTELESNAVLSEYHGYFQIVKLAAINSFVSKHPGSAEYVFKVKRRKFVIEKLYLPPALDVIAGGKVPSMGCASGNKLLDF